MRKIKTVSIGIMVICKSPLGNYQRPRCRCCACNLFAPLYWRGITSDGYVGGRWRRIAGVIFPVAIRHIVSQWCRLANWYGIISSHMPSVENRCICWSFNRNGFLVSVR